MPASIEPTTTRWPLRTTRRRWKRRCAAPKRRTKATPPRKINDLAADAEVPIEELLKQYSEMEKAAQRRRPGRGRQAGGRLHG